MIAGSEEVIALHPDGVQRQHDKWRVSLLDDPEPHLRESKRALAQMTEVDWRTPHSAKYGEMIHDRTGKLCVSASARASLF